MGELNPPVKDSFENGIAHFFTKDTFEGRPILVVFRWNARDKFHPVWSQEDVNLKIGYAFDYNISAFNVPFGTLHELTVALMFDMARR